MITAVYTSSIRLNFDATPSRQEPITPSPRSRAVEVIFQSEELQRSGVIVELGELDSIVGYLDGGLNWLINRVIEAPVTNERLARHLFAWCLENLSPRVRDCLSEVRVSETPLAWASYAAGPT